MVKVNIYGPEGQIAEQVDLSEQPAYNDPKCKHSNVKEVEDDMVGVKALQCQDCMVGWLIKEKIKENE